MQNKALDFAPVALTTTLTTNIFNPPTLTGGVGVAEAKTYAIIRHIRIVNKTGSAATFSLWKGATGTNAAGKEVVGQALSVAANSAYDWVGYMYFSTADFLVGGAGTATALSIQLEGEIGVAD